MLSTVRGKIVQPLYILSCAVLLLAFSLHYAEVKGTLAFSSDTEKSKGNIFQAGTWGAEKKAATLETSGVEPLGHIIISEVLYDPNESDTGQQWIELYNGTDSDVDMGGMEINATSGDDFVFPSGFKLSQYSFVVVHWNAEGIDTGRDLYASSSSESNNMGNAGGWVALFKKNSHSKDAIVDYIEYGAGGQTAENEATGAGIWTAGNFIPDVAEGHSIEKIEKDIDSNLYSEFKDQATPTPGQ